MTADRRKIAFWFRYGPAEHAEMAHNLPDTIRMLSKQCEVHYFGMKSGRPTPPSIAENATTHYLPFTVDRRTVRDKYFKTFLWYLWLPYVALRCRFMKIDILYIDETLPLTTLIGKVFYGGKIAVTVCDCFVDIYLSQYSFLSPIRRLIKIIDYACWRQLSLVFTKTNAARKFLTTKGIPSEITTTVPDPCDTALYRPVNRQRAREAFGFVEEDIVLVHHGILHPNKGNDLILQSIADIRSELPHLRYLLVGSGPEEKRLREMTDQLGLNDVVTFTGWLPSPTEVNTALNAADIGLVMRIGQESDDFHVTGALAHNMAVGLAVLAARLAGIAEIIRHNENGLLFNPRHMNEFKTNLLTLSRDPDLRKRLGKAAHGLAVSIFDKNRIADQIATSLLANVGISEDM